MGGAEKRIRSDHENRFLYSKNPYYRFRKRSGKVTAIPGYHGVVLWVAPRGWNAAK